MLQNNENLEKEIKEGTEAPVTSLEVSPKVLADVVVTLCSGSNLTTEDRQQLALDALLPTHHPIIGK